MALPVINKTPQYKLKLPVSKKEITFRPFLAGEEKILLLALETGQTPDDFLNAFAQVVTNCVKEEIDIENLPVADIDYLFLKCRAKSIGEIINGHIRCENKECNKLVSFTIDIDTITPTEQDDKASVIKITDEIHIKMRCPSLADIRKHTDESDHITFSFDMMLDCLDYITNGDEIIHAKEYKKEELEEWMNGFSIDDFKKINEFFSTIPRVQYENENVKCVACGHQNKVYVEGTRDFFTLLSHT